MRINGPFRIHHEDPMTHGDGAVSLADADNQFICDFQGEGFSGKELVWATLFKHTPDMFALLAEVFKANRVTVPAANRWNAIVSAIEEAEAKADAKIKY